MRNDPEQRRKADALLDATQSYARKLATMPEGIAELADSTGFSPEGVRAAIGGIRNLENGLTAADWVPESLFGSGGRMADLFGVMLRVPQLKQNLVELGGSGFDRSRISDITCDWVNGKGLEAIAGKYFRREKDDEAGTAALTDTCRAIYRTIVNSGTWGVSALSRMSGIDFETLSEAEKRKINALPAMIYHGVSSEDAVLMRMNCAPRSAAEALGSLYREVNGRTNAGIRWERRGASCKDLVPMTGKECGPRERRCQGLDTSGFGKSFRARQVENGRMVNGQATDWAESLGVACPVAGMSAGDRKDSL